MSEQDQPRSTDGGPNSATGEQRKFIVAAVVSIGIVGAIFACALAFFYVATRPDQRLISDFVDWLESTAADSTAAPPRKESAAVLVQILEDCEDGALDLYGQWDFEKPMIRDWLYRLGFRQAVLRTRDHDRMVTALLTCLRRASGQDHGTDAKAWQMWLTTYEPPAPAEGPQHE